MNFNFFNLPIPYDIIQAFSWTLLHSVWQGLILAVLAGIILIVTKKAKPAFRYNLLSGLLLVFILVSCFTFVYELYKPEISKDKIVYSAGSESGNWIVTKADIHFKMLNKSHNKHFITVIMNFCSKNAAIIVAVWLLVFLLKSVRAAAGFYYVHEIRHRRIHDVNEHWKQNLSQLAKKLKISKTISLAESEIVQIPMVTGFLKPMILVPLGFLTSLPFSQVEAILLHELAHIRRKDYLVNLFQNFAENVFFFNPAILWISHLIREEREHCCDDLAIDVTQNKASFVHALVLFQEYKIAGSTHAFAFAGKRNHLLDRIKRIIYNNNKQLDAMEKLFVTASLFTVAALSLAFSPDPVKDAAVSSPVQEKVQPFILIQNEDKKVVLKDTIPAKKQKKSSDTSVTTIHITKNDKRYEIEQKNGEITELKIDGKVIPKDKIESYESEIEPILEEVKEQKENSETFRVQADNLHKQAELIKTDAEKQKKGAEKFRVSADQFRVEAGDIRKQAEIMQKAANGFREQAEVMKKKAEEMREQAEIMRKEGEVIQKEGEKTRAAYEKIQAEFINDLIKEGVIKDKNNLSYKLSDSELIVNGVKQPEQLHRKLKDKYLEGSGVEMVYNWKQGNSYFTGLIKTE